MDQLADDVLLEVLQHLSVEDLLTCRLVSKRLSSLALHPDAWRRQYHGLNDLSNYGCCAVFHLAPRLAILNLHLDRPFEGLCPQLYVTTCAVKEMHLRVAHRSVAAAVAIHRQVSLGRLRSVYVTIDAAISSAENTSFLFYSLALARGLQNLGLSVPEGMAEVSVLKGKTPHIFVPSSLRKLIVYTYSNMELFVNHVLATHAATLVDVDFRYANLESTATASPLLAGMPNLCTLTCVLISGLEALVACKSLRTVHIESLDPVPIQHAQGAATLLREAHHLSQVHLKLSDDLCAELVSALGSSGLAHVEKLELSSLDGCDDRYGPALLRALPRLPFLRDVSMYSFDKLRDISSEEAAVSLPLRKLGLDQCVHNWVHEDAGRAFLLTNPALHVTFKICEACKQDWIQPPGSDTELALLFIHPESECPAPGYHYPYLPGIHISWDETNTSTIRQVSM